MTPARSKTLLRGFSLAGVILLGVPVIVVACADPEASDSALARSGAALAGDWVRCASEGERCAFSGTRRVAYGTDAVNRILTFTDGTSCSNAVFGDPIYGVVKSCWYERTATDPCPAPTPPTWTACATEGQQCTFSGTKQVRYGTEAVNVIRTLAGGTACTNAVFGDPLRGTVKSCWYADLPSTCAPPDGGGAGEGGAGGGGGGPTTPGAVLNATRTSGPAPLAVEFDAIGTTLAGTTNPVHDVEYTFDFGDDRGQTWPVSGEPKNVQRGAPLAAHVFDTPGTYVVRMRATRGTTASEASVTITVAAPETTWPGTQTVCVSTTGNYGGCPAAASHSTTLPASYDRKRVLLRRGESFGRIDIANTDNGVTVGSFGSGAKPRVSSIYLGGNGTVAAWPDEITLMDLDVAGGFSVAVTGSRILLYRCDLVTPNTEKVDVGTAVGYYVEHGQLPASSYRWPREIFLVDNQILGDINEDQTPGLGVMGFFARSALLGNTINRATEHSVRLWAAYKTVIAHNAIGGEHYAANPPGIRAALKVHSGGIAPYDDNIGTSGLGFATRYVFTAANRFGTTRYQGSWLVGFGPQNGDPGTVEGVEDVILERDTFERGPYTSQEIHLLARRVTVRGATVIGGAPISIDGVTADESRADPAMDPWCGPYYGQAATGPLNP